MNIRYVFLIIYLLVTIGTNAQKFNRRKFKNVAVNYLDTHFQKYDSIQKAIHNYAELGYQEYKSSSLLQKHLRENGFAVEAGVAGIPTSFVATFGSGEPVIGMLAEFDALPGLSQDTVPYPKLLQFGGSGHGCGHNLLGTAAVAGAVSVSKWLSATGHLGTITLQLFENDTCIYEDTGTHAGLEIMMHQ